MKNKSRIFLLLILLMFNGLDTQVAHAADEPARITVYVVPPITNEKILPTTVIPDSYISNEISIVASPGEYEPASFVIKTLNDITSLEVEATELEGESGSIPPSYIDIRVVKCWYQAGYATDTGLPPDITHKHLESELLLKDDSLVKVENEENYLKLTNGSYLWISDPTIVEDMWRPRTIEEVPVRDSPTLLPVDIPAGTNKQFWVTIKIPVTALPGTYLGAIELSTPGGLLQRIDVILEVLPIELKEPYLEYSLYYGGWLDANWPNGSISKDYKSEQQLTAELHDMVDHGVTNTSVYQGVYQDPIDWNYLGRFLQIRNEIMGPKPLYYLGLTPGNDYMMDPERVPEILSFVAGYGINEVYFYGLDECLGNLRNKPDGTLMTPQEAVDLCLSQRPDWEKVHQYGGKIFVAGVPVGFYSDTRSVGEFGLVGDLLDAFVCYGRPNKDEASRWHSLGHKIFCYAYPQVGAEQPETYRRNFGLLLWQADYDGAMDFAYNWGWGNLWNDFDATSRDRMFGYPTLDGVVSTTQWEGWREGVDDVKYLTTLLALIEEAKESMDTSVAEDWLADLKSSDLATMNLDAVRLDMISLIRYLHPPILHTIGDKTVMEGKLLNFTISGTDPDGDPLSFSASNLPPGASFVGQTFNWTPTYTQAGTYSIKFTVTDSVNPFLCDSQSIIITVNNLHRATWISLVIAGFIAFLTAAFIFHRFTRKQHAKGSGLTVL